MQLMYVAITVRRPIGAAGHCQPCVGLLHHSNTQDSYYSLRVAVDSSINGGTSKHCKRTKVLWPMALTWLCLKQQAIACLCTQQHHQKASKH